MQIQQTNIHDAFFKSVLSQSEMADAFLREHLPRELAELLAPEAPEQISGSFVDEELAQHHSDLLFRLHLKTGDDALAYVFLEHKSAPDRLARLQLLRYIVRILVDWHKEHKTLPLPLVVPMLAHQGPDGWKFSTDFGDLYDSAALAVEDVVQILNYIAKGPVPVSDEILQDVLRRLEPSRKDQIMASFGAEFAQEGFERGLAEGRSIGEAQGKVRGQAIGQALGQALGQAKALIRLLEKRFDPLPPHLCDRIYAADVTSIESWFDRAVDALDLQSVFGAEARDWSHPLEQETH